MSPKNSLASYKLRSILEVLYRCRSSNFFGKQPYERCTHIPVVKPGHGYVTMQQGLQFITSTNSGKGRKSDANIYRGVEDEKNKSQPPLPPPPPPPSTSIFANWGRWLLGSILSIFLPSFWRAKMEKLQRIEGEVEKVAEEVEHVAKVVEKVATATEKVSEELADKLPNNSKLKQTTLLVEQVSKVVAEDAKFTEDLIHKVDALKQNLEDLDTMVEPIINKIVERESGGK